MIIMDPASALTVLTYAAIIGLAALVNVANILKGSRWHQSLAVYWPLALMLMVRFFRS